MPFYIEEKPKIFAQGDIFKNIPYMSLDVLRSVDSTPKDIKLDETKEIIKNICMNGGTQLIKTFIASTMCILISQDCDVVNKHNKRDTYYTFLPLESIPEAKSYTFKQIDNIIRKEKFNCYLPELIKENDSVFGPYKIRFEFPISIARKDIEPYLKENWIARIPSFTKQLLASKYSQFYIRPAIDEVMYMNLRQINDEIQEIWNDNKLTEAEKKKKVDEFRDALNLIKRDDVLNEIVWVSLNDIVSYTNQIFSTINHFSDRNSSTIKDLCIKSKETTNNKEKIELFKSIINELYLKPEAFYQENLFPDYNIEDIQAKKFHKRTREESNFLNMNKFSSIKKQCLDLNKNI